MKASSMVALLFVLALLGRSSLLAQDPPDAPASLGTSSDAAPDELGAELTAELDAFRNGLFGLFNERKYQQMLDEYVHEDVIAIWQDGTISHGHAGVLAEFEKLSEFIDTIQVQPTITGRVALDDGDLIISSGQMEDTYALKRGVNVALHSGWTSTLIKRNGQWKLISFSGNANAFDNEVVDLYLQQARYTGGGIGGVVGLLIGAVGALMISRRRK